LVSQLVDFFNIILAYSFVSCIPQKRNDCGGWLKLSILICFTHH